MTEDTARPGNRADAATNGHRNDAEPPPDPLGDEARSPYDKRPAKLTEDAKYGSPEAATTASGMYVAELAKARGKFDQAHGGYGTVQELQSVLLANARSAGLIDKDHRPSQAEVARWHAKHSLEWEETPATVDLAGLKVAAKGLNGKQLVAVTTLDALEGKRWASRAVDKAYTEATDPSVPWKHKTAAFSLAELNGKYGAPIGDLITLPEMDDDARRASWHLLRVWAKVEDQRAYDAARKRLAAAEAAEITLPPVNTLDALLATPDDPVRMRIAEVWPSGGAKVLCAGPAGGGKTTLTGNLVRSLADGDPFLGVFEVHQRAERIVVIDNEMTPAMLKRWLRRQGVRNTAAVADVVCLRGRAGLFDLGNDRLREMWARRLADLGADFVVFDCLSPVINAMGLKESTELGKFLHPLTDMLTAAGVADVLVHHHMGHAEERSRGDSTALGWSDANWKIVRKEDHPLKPRYFATDKVRDADLVPEGLLSWDRDTNRLTYVGGDRTATGRKETVEARVAEVRAVLVDHHAANPTDDKGLTKTDLKIAVGGNKKLTTEAIDLVAKRRLAVVTKGRGDAKWYRIAPKALDPAYIGEDHSVGTDGGAEPVAGPSDVGA